MIAKRNPSAGFLSTDSSALFAAQWGATAPLFALLVELCACPNKKLKLDS